MGQFSEDLENLTRAIWRQEKRKGGVRIPTPHDLAAHVLQTRSSITETAERIDALVTVALSGALLFPLVVPSLLPEGAIDHERGEIEDEDACSASIRAFWSEQMFCGTPTPEDADSIRVHIKKVGTYIAPRLVPDNMQGGVAYLYMAALGYEVGSYAVEADGATIERGLDAVNAAWETHGRDNEIKHPVAPLVTNWLDTPPVVEIDTRITGIIAAPVARRRDCEQASWLPAPVVLEAPRTEQAYLPMFTLPVDTNTLYLPPTLNLWDSSGRMSTSRGPGAPLSLRLFHEVMLWVPLHERRGERTIMPTLREVVYALWPKGWNRGKDWDKLQKALYAVHNTYVPTVSHMLQPVSVRAMPRVDSDMDTRFLFRVLMPPGSDHGVLVHRETLRLLGLRSSPGYRAYLWLCYHWDVPRRVKDSSAYPVIDDRQIDTICYGNVGRMSDAMRRKRVQRAKRVLAGMESANICFIERNAIDRHGRRGWRFPCPSWHKPGGADFPLLDEFALR